VAIWLNQTNEGYMSEHSRFISGMLSGAGAFFAKVVVNIVIIPVIIKLLGLDDFGLYVLFLNLSEILITLGAGFTTGLIHRLSHHHSLNDSASFNEQLGVAQSFYGLIAILIIGLSWVINPSVPQIFHLSAKHTEIASVAFLLVIVDAVINFWGFYPQGVLKAHSLYKNTNITETVQTLVSALLTLGLLMMGYGLIAILVSRLVVSVLTVISLYWQAISIMPEFSKARPKLSVHGIKDLFSISFYSLIQRISGIVAHRIDGFVIAAFLSMSEVGIYSLILRIFSYVSGFATKLMEGMFPIFTRMAAQDTREKSRFFFLRSSTFLNFLTGNCLIVIMGNYPEIIAFLTTGKVDYQQTVLPAVIIAGFTWSGSLQMPASNYLFASGWHRFQTITSMITAALNLGLSILLVQQIGVTGIALGTLIPHVIQHNLLTVFWACKSLEISVREYIFQVYLKNLPGFLAGGGLLLLMRYCFGSTHVPLVYQLLVNALVFILVVACWYFLVAIRDERQMCYSTIQKISAKFTGKKKQNYGALTEDYSITH
jgi:O-antigen/teichoic acid export membrane protein